MEDSREEEQGLVCYTHKNPSDITVPLSTSKNPGICSKDSSVAWYNLEKTKPAKAYDKCTEFDGYIRKSGSSLDFHPMDEHPNPGEKENAISSCLEVVIRDKQLRTSGEVLEKCSNGLKRSRVLSEEVSQPSGVSKKQKMNHEEKPKTGDLCSERNDIEITRNNIDPVNINQHGVIMETTLVEVDLAIEASSRAENVPFVCLTSKSKGQAILGHPIEVEALSQSSEETSVPGKESGVSNDRGRKGLHQLVWRTSKRTPVCYITNSLSASVSKNPKRFKRGNAPQSTSCVPVELVFSKILAAVGEVQS